MKNMAKLEQSNLRLLDMTDRVLIYPTGTMRKWMIDHSKKLQPKTRSQFYVAITRASYSVGIVFDYDEKTNIEGVENYL